jgi:hypothetical protein
MDHSLLDRLKSLGVQVGTSQVKKPGKSSDRVPIDKVIDGTEHTTPFGSAFLADERFPTDYQHGLIPFNQTVDFSLLGEWAGYPTLNEKPADQFIFLDTETTGLAGGTGTFAFMIGLGWWQADGFRLQQFFLREPAEETAVLAALDEVLTPFQTVVTYNGKSFDIPLLNARHILSAFQSPFPGMKHVDLLALSRRIWRNRLPSRSLGSIEHDILAVSRSEEEIPGWMIPEMYFNYLKSGDSRPMAGVFYHNRIDILSLAALFLHQSNLLSSPMDWLSTEGLDLIAIAKLYDETGRRDQAVQLYEHSLSLGLPRPFFIQTLYRYADLARKELSFNQAVNLWQKAADVQELPACVELAKYYEHQAREYETALYWTQKAFEILDTQAQPLYLKKLMQSELQKRQARLQRKLNNRGSYTGPVGPEEDTHEQS